MKFKCLLNKLLNTKDKKILLENFFSLSILQIFSYVLPLLTFPYLVKVLGVEKFGLVAFASSLMAFFNILVDYGFNLSATREVAVNRGNESKITEIYSSVISIKVILILFSFLILSIIVYAFEKFRVDNTLYFFTFIVVIGQALFPIWYFQGIEKMKYITIVNITSKVLFTIAIFVFVHSETDYLLVPLLTGLGSIVGSIYALYIIKRQFKQEFRFQTFDALKKHFKDSSQFFLSRISVSVYTSANAFVLGLFTNNTMVGYYAIAEKLYIAIESAYNPIMQVLYPYMSKNKNLALFKKIFISSSIFNVIGVIILYIFVDNIFSLLFGNMSNLQSINVFTIFLIVTTFLIPSVMLGYPLLGAYGLASHVNKSTIYSSLMHLLGLILLIGLNFINIYSVTFMILVTQFFNFIYRIYGVKKYKIWNK